MLSICLTSIALQSLLACPWDIGHIFHWRVKDWQWLGKASSEVATGRGKIVPVLEIGGGKSHVFRGRKDVFFWGPPFPFSFLFCLTEIWFRFRTFDSQLQRWKAITSESIHLTSETDLFEGNKNGKLRESMWLTMISFHFYQFCLSITSPPLLDSFTTAHTQLSPLETKAFKDLMQYWC